MRENAEQSNDPRGYSAAQVSKFEEQVRKLRSESARLKFDLGCLSEQLTASRAKTFAQQGFGRRFHLIERCVLNIFEIYPAGRQEFLRNWRRFSPSPTSLVVSLLPVEGTPREGLSWLHESHGAANLENLT